MNKSRRVISQLTEAGPDQGQKPDALAALVAFAKEVVEAFEEHESGDLNDIPADIVIERGRAALKLAGADVSSLQKYKVEQLFGGDWGDPQWEENEHPMRFDTEEEAWVEVDEFLADAAAAAEAGHMAAGFSRDEFRVVPA
jgi:hypothetical protein